MRTLTSYQMLFKCYSRPPVHLAFVPCEIYLLKVLVTHGKLGRWCIYSTQTLVHTYTDTHANTHHQESRGAWGPFVSSFLSSPLLLSIPPPFSRCRYMYYLYACPSLDTDASCFAILNRSNQQCVKQEWIFYALGVRTSKSLLQINRINNSTLIQLQQLGSVLLSSVDIISIKM